MNKTKKMTTLAMLCALAYAVMVVGRIPIVLFLKYDPKDVIITIGAFIFGPMTAVITSVIVSLVEMFSVSDTGIIGCIMNILSTLSFAGTAAYIYKKNHNLKGAIIGLVCGTILMTSIMLLWNYLITPIYMQIPRETVADMLIPTFLPFNLVKGGLNAGITLLLYKPVVTALRRFELVEQSTKTKNDSKNGAIIIGFIVLVTSVFFALVMKGII